MLLLAAAVAAYLVAAWQVQPGFFDGFAPPGRYRWVSPPPGFEHGNQPPEPGHGQVLAAPDGLVNGGTVLTGDGQASISFEPGALVVPAGTRAASIDIEPEASSPPLASGRLVTNVYCITSNARIAPGKQVLLTLVFSSELPAPSEVYGYQGHGPWRELGTSRAAIAYRISAQISWLGCFAGVFTGSRPRQGTSKTLPVVVAGAMLGVLLAGLPLILLRRRRRPLGGAGSQGPG